MASKRPSSSRSMYWVGGGVVAVGALAVAAGFMLGGGSADGASGLPAELSAEALKAQAESDPGALRETMRENMRRDDLTNEQRRALASNMREVRRSMMAERVDEWYAAESEEEKAAILDRQIDEFQRLRAEWERRREEREREGAEEGDDDRERFRQMFASRSKEERKTSSESRNPDQTARMMVYFSAVRARMGERGISMPQGPGRHGGRWGRP